MTTITVPRAVLEQALAAMDKATRFMSDSDYVRLNQAIDALRASLVQQEQEQEPVAWRSQNATPPGGFVIFQQYPQALADLGGVIEPLYTTPPRREWQSLSEEEIGDAQDAAAIQFRESRHGVRGQQLMPSDSPDWWLARAIEAALKEKNQ